MSQRLLCDFCHRASQDQVRGIPHCARHLVEAMLLAEDESDPSG
jgi:hypothetical protein